MIVWNLIISCISFNDGDTIMFEGLNLEIIDESHNVSVTGYIGSPTDIVLKKSFFH